MALYKTKLLKCFKNVINFLLTHKKHLGYYQYNYSLNFRLPLKKSPQYLLKPTVTKFPALSSLTLCFMNNSRSDERLCEPECRLDTKNTPVTIQQIYNLCSWWRSVYRQPSHFKGSFKRFLSHRCLITGVDSSTGMRFSSVEWNYLSEDTNLPVSLFWLYALYSVTTSWQSPG